jgi:iron complex outermembrane receptor protein
VLPSFNLKLDLDKDLVARFDISKTMSRPDYTALAGTVTPGSPPQIIGGVVQGPGGGSGGNPNLQPIISNNVDGTIEWYFAPRSLLSLSLFEMDMTSYVGYGTTTQLIQSVGGSGIPVGTVLPYEITSPVNMGAIVKGTEISYEQPFLRDFGVSANYTYINAADQFGNPVVGASKNTANLTLYYEANKFNARVAYNFRSAFYSGLDRSTAFFQDSTTTVAASLGYKYNENLAFTLDGMNLNNPVLKYYGAAGESQPERFYVNGRQFYLTAHVKY